MKPLKELLKIETSRETLNKRQATLKKFLEKLNKDRKENGYKPLTGQRIAVMLSHLDQWDLDAFYASCEEKGKNFSKFFWWSLK